MGQAVKPTAAILRAALDELSRALAVQDLQSARLAEIELVNIIEFLERSSPA